MPERVVQHQSDLERAVAVELSSKELTDTRRQELDRGLAAAMDFMQAAKVIAYIAGGGAVDLMNGQWDRDHQDLDIAIYSSDRRKFFEAALAAGYRIVPPGDSSRSLSEPEILDPKLHNAFLFKDSDGSAFEVMFLDDGLDGQIEVVPGVRVPRELYEQSQRVQIAKREVMLTPPEVNLFHKIIDGRRKDYRDVIDSITTLSTVQRQSLDGYIQSAQVQFTIGDQVVSNLDELLSLVPQTDNVRRAEFFGSEARDLEVRLNEDLMRRCDEIYDIYERNKSDKSDFLRELEVFYGSQLTPERRQTLTEIANEFFDSGRAHTRDTFKNWAKVFTGADQRLIIEATKAFDQQKLWAVKFGK